MLLNNRYLIHEPIGRGGLATIYCGFNNQMQRSVAVKVLREVYSPDPKFVRCFQKEAEVMFQNYFSKA
jgi:serine/threonine protein kinase